MEDLLQDTRLLAAANGLAWILGVFGSLLAFQGLLEMRKKMELSTEAFRNQEVYAKFGSIEIDLNSVICACALMLLIAFIMGSFVFAIIAGVLGLTLPSLYRIFQADQVRKRFERDLPRTVEQLARRIRSGKSFEEAIKLSSKDAPRGTKLHMQRMARELELNAPLDQVLKSAATPY